MRTTILSFALHLLLTMVSFSQSFIDLNTPFSSKVRVLYMSNTSTLFAGGDIGFFKTTDLGQNWDTLLTENTRSIYIHNDSTWYLCTYSGIYKTTDSGEQWNPFGQSLPTSLVDDIAINKHSNSFFVATSLGVFKSTDEGNNWIITLNSSTSDNPNIECINDTIIFLGKSSSANFDNLFHSTNNGSNWEVVDLGSFRGRLYKTPGNILFLEYKALPPTRLYKSTNGGLNWLEFEDTFISSTAFGPWTDGINNSIIMAKMYWGNVGAHFILLFVSFDNFQTYTRYGQYSPLWASPSDLSESITSLTSNINEDIFAGLMNGTIRIISGISLTGIDDELVSNSTQFKLNQNYPNPFNPSTKISWQSPVSGWQTLKLYDVLGNEVATLVNEYRNAGSYEVEFKSAVSNRQLASGVYYYQLRVGDPSTGSGQGFVETKKMILLK